MANLSYVYDGRMPGKCGYHVACLVVDTYSFYLYESQFELLHEAGLIAA